MEARCKSGCSRTMMQLAVTTAMMLDRTTLAAAQRSAPYLRPELRQRLAGSPAPNSATLPTSPRAATCKVARCSPRGVPSPPAPGRQARMRRAASPASARSSNAAARTPARSPRSDWSYDHSYDQSLPRHPNPTPAHPRSKGGKQRGYALTRKAACRPRLPFCGDNSDYSPPRARLFAARYTANIANIRRKVRLTRSN